MLCVAWLAEIDKLPEAAGVFTPRRQENPLQPTFATFKARSALSVVLLSGINCLVDYVYRAIGICAERGLE
jgi:hypothetical protein